MIKWVVQELEIVTKEGKGSRRSRASRPVLRFGELDTKTRDGMGGENTRRPKARAAALDKHRDEYPKAGPLVRMRVTERGQSGRRHDMGRDPGAG